MAFPSNFKLIRQQNVTTPAAAVNLDVAARIIYIGPRPTDAATVGGVALRTGATTGWDPAVIYTASSTQSLAFSLDYGTTADTGIYSGATPGTITLSELADLTFGTLAAKINASANWRMVLVGALPSDAIHVSTTYNVLAITTSAGTDDNAHACAAYNYGTALYWATAVSLNSTLCLGPEAETGSTYAPVHQRLSGKEIVLKRDVTNVKDSSFTHHIANQPSLLDTSVFLTTCSAAVQDGGAATTTLTVYAATQTSSRTLYSTTGTSNSQLASATVKTISSADLGYDPLLALPGERIVFRVNSNALAKASLSLTGGYGYLLT